MVGWLMLGLLMIGAWKKLPLYDAFVQGARSGMTVAVQVLPNLAAMLCAVSLMNASGLMDALCRFCAPVFSWMGLPSEVAPLVFIRPLSGSGALAVLENILQQHGPDSRIGLIACTLMGSSETIFYTVCIYLSASRSQRSGYAIPCALIGMLAGSWLAGMLF